MTGRPEPERFEAVVFDLDGLLVDSEPVWRAAEIEIFGRYGVPLTEAQCRSAKGRPVHDVAWLWHRQHPWEGPSPEAVADEVIDRMAQLLADQVPLMPGARAALAWCREQGLRLAVASSSGHRLIEAALGRHGLRPWFEVVCSAQDVPAGKPAPDVYLAAAGALGVLPGRCVAVEDATLGAEAAVTAGMACVMVPEPGGPPPQVPRGVDAVLGSLEELPAAWPVVAAAFGRRQPSSG